MPPFPKPGRTQNLGGLITLTGNPGHKLFGEAALSFNDMYNSAPVIIEVVSAHRTYEQQADLYRRLGAYHPVRNPHGAAKPGTSNHERGKAIDIDRYTGQDVAGWMRKHASSYGFVNDVATEPWHYTYQGQYLWTAGLEVPLLAKGDKGTPVRSWQQLLRANGHSSTVGKADGDFGPRTDTATRAYQAANGLRVDGICGPGTLATLLGPNADA